MFELEATLIYYADEKIDVINKATLTGYEGNTDIVKLEVGSSCTLIGENAFKGCSNLEEVNASGSNCITVGQRAFHSNTGLKKVNLPNVKFEGIAHFATCTNLQEVTFGSVGHPVTTIASDAFYNCTQSDLTIKIYVSSGTTSLAYEPWGVTNATIEYYDATTGELVNVIWGQKYKGNTDIIELPNADKITKILAGAFEGCTNLALTQLPNNLISIGENAFKGCSNLEEINASGSNCITVGQRAFHTNTGLKKVNLPNVKFEGIAHFSTCTNLQEVTFGSVGHPVTAIASDAFYNCTQSDLTIKVYVESGTTNLAYEPWGATNATIEYYDAATGELVNVIWGQKYKGDTEINWTELPNANKITKISAGAFEGCTSLALTQLPNNLISIGNNAFYGCTSLVKLELPESLTTIGEYAFRNCSNLEEVNASGNNCITVSSRAFHTNTGLKKVNLPNVKFQGNAYFSTCTGLQEVTFGSIGHPITTLPWDTFYNCTQTGLTIKIYVASGTTSLANQPWGATKATIEYYDSTTGERIN